MREVGIRELKASLSRTLVAVRRGEQVRITFRGRPVADIVPVDTTADEDHLRQLVTRGRVVLPAHPHPVTLPPLAKSARSASAVVLSERDAER